MLLTDHREYHYIPKFIDLYNNKNKTTKHISTTYYLRYSSYKHLTLYLKHRLSTVEIL